MHHAMGESFYWICGRGMRATVSAPAAFPGTGSPFQGPRAVRPRRAEAISRGTRPRDSGHGGGSAFSSRMTDSCAMLELTCTDVVACVLYVLFMNVPLDQNANRQHGTPLDVDLYRLRAAASTALGNLRGAVEDLTACVEVSEGGRASVPSGSSRHNYQRAFAVAACCVLRAACCCCCELYRAAE